MYRISLAISLVVAFALPGFADSREERLSVATEYVEATLEDMDMPAVIKTMWIPLVQQVESTGQTLIPEQLDEIDALYQATFSEPMFEIMRAQIEVMAEILSLEEITALRDFYATEHGRSAMRKLPQMMERQQPMIMALVQEQVPEILPQLKAIIDGE